MSKVTYIYSLSDPVTGKIRYIGKSDNPEKRYNNHLKGHGNRSKSTYCYNWIKGLASRELTPALAIIESCSEENWKERERFWIEHCRAAGENLTNLTKGGDGLIGFHHSEESKRKMSQSRMFHDGWNKGMKHSEETKRKIGAKSKGKKGPMSERGRNNLFVVWEMRRELISEFKNTFLKPGTWVDVL